MSEPETTAVCAICGEPMPPGEQMFKFHGYSGPCPKPPLPKKQTAARSPVWQIEFIGDGNAVVRRANDSESLMPAGDVADFLRKEFPNG